MKAFILCDGSYDSNLRIGACAYSVVINGETLRNTVRVADIASSTECEMFAMYAAVLKLKEKLKEMSMESKLNAVHIFSDSETGIRALKKSPRTPKERQLYRELKDKIKGNLNTLANNHYEHKVEAHRKDAEASHIEKKHNEIDVMARNELNAFREDLLFLDNHNSKICGVALNGTFSAKDEKKYFQLGYHLAHQGYTARIYNSPGEKTHPFVKGIRDYCDKKRIKSSSRVEILPHFKYLGREVKDGCVGLDTSLVLTALNEKKTSLFDPYRKSMIRAAAFTRLIYGTQEQPQKKGIPIYQRPEKCAEFILNLSHEPLTKSMLDNITSRVGMPVYHGSEELKAELNGQNRDCNVTDCTM